MVRRQSEARKADRSEGELDPVDWSTPDSDRVEKLPADTVASDRWEGDSDKISE